MANYGLTNNLSALPLHSTSTYDSELIVVDNNAGRPITARASYITNLNDISVTLAAGNLDVGSFHIEDPDSGLKANVLGAGIGQGGIVSLIADTTTGLLANVVDVGNGQGALRVLSHDLESSVDDITIGDRNGNFAYVTSSALNVFTTNGISAVSVTNFPTQLTAVSITNQLTGLTILNPVTAVTVNNLSTYISGLTSVIATASNQVTTNSLLNALTGNNATATNQVITNTLLNALTSSNATAINQTATNTLLNSITANQAIEITLQKTLTASNATASNQVITNTLLNSITANQATAANQSTTNTLFNSLTASEATLVTLTKTLTANNATSVNQVTTNTLLNSLTANVATSSNQVITNSLLNVLTGNNATASNQVITNTLLNAVTSNQVTFNKSVTAVTIINPVTSVSVTNFPTQLTAVSVTNFPTQLTAVSLTNQITSVSITNPVTAVTVNNPISAFDIVACNLTLPVSGSVTIANSISTTPVGTQNVTFADSVQLDEASRLRVAIPQTQWWYVASVDKDGDLRYNESFVGGASSIFVQNLASVNLTSGTTSVSGQAIRASRRRHKIMPGNSHEYIGVWNWDGQQANTVKRIGIFTQFNGYMFELSGTNAMNAVVRRRLPDGTLVEERVNQTNWNGDKLDGTGPSGENWNALTQNGTINSWVSTTPISIQNDGTVYNVVYTLSAGQVQNFRQGTKATITGITPSGYNAVATIINTDTLTNRLTANYLFNPGVSASNASAGSMVQTGFHMQHTYWIDFMGGRTNRVRFGKVSDYGKIVLHTFRFDGLLGTAYENAPTLTERKEIFNIGTPTSLPSFTVMGNAFNVEAAVDIVPNFNMARNDTGVTIDTGQEFPILGVGLRAGEPYQRADIQIQNIAINDVANSASGDEFGTVSWRLVLNPSIQGALPSPTNIGKASRQWAYTTSNTVSGGIDLMGGYLMSKTAENLSTALNFLNMGSNIDNTDADKVVLVAKLVQRGHAASNIVATMNFIEAL